MSELVCLFTPKGQERCKELNILSLKELTLCQDWFFSCLPPLLLLFWMSLVSAVETLVLRGHPFLNGLTQPCGFDTWGEAGDTRFTTLGSGRVFLTVS